MDIIGDALLSTVIEFLFDKLASSDLMKFARHEDVHTELKKWEKELQSIREELNDAEEKQITQEAVKSWLFDLRDLAYDMEDILDEFAYEVMRRKLMGAEADEASTSKIRRFVSSCCTSFNPTHVVRNVKTGSKIRQITSRLQDISARKARFGLEKLRGAAATSAWQRPPPTTPMAYEPDVYGRDEDKTLVLDMLRKVEPNENNVGLISIVGMGGLGKTTLARLVYNDDLAKNFELRAWVCVTEDFDVEKITKAILNSVLNSDASGSLDFQQVQRKLTDTLAGKTLFLILDDVWNENYCNWDRLRAPFSVVAKGSKVIVTTRNKNVALMMGAAENLHELNPLSEDACWSVFEKHACEHRNMEDHPNLVSIGRKIVGKCGGLPLAAKALGGLLRSKHREEEWERVLNSKIWDFSSAECEILPALRLSYHYLPSYLKGCFAYCAIFPKDYEYDSKTLVLLWMAEGLIQQPNADSQTMEDLGDNYFCELLSRSFFQSSGNDESRFVMHDLICDLARVASGEISFCLEDNLESNHRSTISKETRHSSFIRGKFDVFKKFEAFQEFEHLRTFVALPIHGTFTKSFVTSLVCDRLVPKFRQLRVLSLSEYMIFELPDSIGGLKHLRYLNLSFTQIKLLPDSVTNLYNLQTLILSNCKHLTRLPSKIGNLISLRHLNVVGCSLQDMPQQIGKLKKLQTLSDFIVSKRGFLGIKELKDLSHLRGEICISKLENVVDVQDARDANLKAKLNVERLSMIWSKELDGSHDEDAEMEVLLSLQPHTSLKKLNIEGYGGRQFPNWICDPSYIKLVELSLIGCIRCISVPSVGQLPFLKKLVIKRMDGVKSVGLEFEGQVSLHAKPFQCLESLWFEDMMEWEEWCWSKKSFSCLHQLEIKNCPRLIKKLPTHLTSLVKLSIENCPEMMVPLPTDLPSLEELNIYYCPEMTPQFDNHEFPLMPLRGASRSAIGITSHIYLEVSGISQLSRLQPEFMQSLPRLELLEIDNSGQLQCLWLDGLGLGNLSRLQILSCDQLVSLGEEEEEEQGLPYNLQHLEIRKCDKLEKLPRGLQSYTSLAELIIEDCPKLVSFPEKGFPLMLRGLAISNCESLSSLPDRMMMRNSSNNVCHLEYLEIEECPSLIYFPQGRLPTTLRRLLISNCEKLESLPEEINACALEQLIIERCPSLIGFPKGKLPPTLKKLWIGECEKLESLPEGIMHHHSNNTTNCGLQILDILEGSSLASFPTGKFPSTCKSIMMDNCAQLQPISEEMFHCNNNALEELSILRLPNLKTIPDCLYNLKDLRIEKCENLDLQPHLLRNLTSLASLQITNCENIKVPLSEWGLARLTSLRTLTIGGIFLEATSFSNHHHHFFLLPTTLVEVCISSFQNLESLAFLSLQTLTSLRKLGVFQCPKLQSFIPKEGLPDMLSELYIRDCPLLIQRCSKEKGEDWPKIAHIPCVKIDGKLILEQ
ncbi:putative disease resistance RPP13-like protein 1 [Vitis vinifera]|uniref:putative disease resistance RPP13-like protein 1 n=1 Tax=Vitis vinifera TaxID=29760 RepID=UPI00015CB233|nr:putative disease resistance RPP13-like protein 1 [Vitis vinifera]XP_010659507.1 putative disease resistance RPP13-like protein 1 [Vitis vinifera]XP_010659508.1 putative disease resistance RPP13-like protein 1 [Vitis vinifera]XP_010659509.1 putative disease resistance RPP13-like protein 1 [Vitis vinifera]XP_010659510.1 putative disease resistance RPP13-like protein 1 [Vitis vinifera]XP_019079865.1 putative disease resistance RPP13-like protein 1 [Vitis vinifera]XP_019079866.1 putative disea|eukprot:XP_010659506.1 PREDICTED: putative disease resistance RPP13-like protein 1 isoform X1 [Vitis vinifera]